MLAWGIWGTPTRGRFNRVFNFPGRGEGGGRAGESIALSRSHCQREEGGTRPDVGASSKFQSLSARERHSLPRARRHAAPPALPTALSSASN